MSEEEKAIDLDEEGEAFIEDEVQGEDEENEVQGEEEEEEIEVAEKEENQNELKQDQVPVANSDTNDNQVGEKDENDKKISLMKLGLSNLSTSKMKEMIGLKDNGSGVATVLKMLTPSVLTAQETLSQPVPPPIHVSARMKDLSTPFYFVIINNHRGIK